MAGWQEALGTLARERELAESGAGLLKAYARGDAAAMARGQQLYAQAKAASDGLIERLLLAVQAGDDPGEAPALRTAMEEAVARREGFARHVEAHLPGTGGTRSAVVAAFLGALGAAKPAAETVKVIVETAVKVWEAWREGRELQRRAITARLEAQRWRAFVDVPEAQ